MCVVARTLVLPSWRVTAYASWDAACRTSRQAFMGSPSRGDLQSGFDEDDRTTRGLILAGMGLLTIFLDEVFGHPGREHTPRCPTLSHATSSTLNPCLASVRLVMRRCRHILKNADFLYLTHKLSRGPWRRRRKKRHIGERFSPPHRPRHRRSNASPKALDDDFPEQFRCNFTCR